MIMGVVSPDDIQWRNQCEQFISQKSLGVLHMLNYLII